MPANKKKKKPTCVLRLRTDIRSGSDSVRLCVVSKVSKGVRPLPRSAHHSRLKSAASVGGRVGITSLRLSPLPVSTPELFNPKPPAGSAHLTHTDKQLQEFSGVPGGWQGRNVSAKQGQH